MASTSSAALDVEALIFKRLHPHIYLSRFLSSSPSIREDGRSPLSSRPVSAVLGSLGAARGSCLVRLGRTSVVAAVSAEVARPRDEAPDCGWIVPSVDMGPLCSPRFKPGPPGEEAQVLLDRVMAVLDASPPLDLSTLCIEYGEAVWCLYVDLVCISYDGAVLDAAMLAIMGALADAKLPGAKWDADASQVICSPSPADEQRLSLQSLPLSCSFGGYKGAHLLADPTAFESALLDSSLILALSAPPASSAPTAAPQLVLLQQQGVCSTIFHASASADGDAPPSKHAEGERLNDEATLELALGLARRRYKLLREALDEAVAAREEDRGQ